MQKSVRVVLTQVIEYIETYLKELDQLGDSNEQLTLPGILNKSEDASQTPKLPTIRLAKSEFENNSYSRDWIVHRISLDGPEKPATTISVSLTEYANPNKE